MWGIISIGAMAVIAAAFSLAKAASRADRMADGHLEELLARKKETEEASDSPEDDQGD